MQYEHHFHLALRCGSYMDTFTVTTSVHTAVLALRFPCLHIGSYMETHTVANTGHTAVSSFSFLCAAWWVSATLHIKKNFSSYIYIYIYIYKGSGIIFLYYSKKNLRNVFVQSSVPEYSDEFKATGKKTRNGGKRLKSQLVIHHNNARKVSTCPI